MIPETNNPLRDRLAARGRLRALAGSPDPKPDPSDCPHPLDEARFDGLWRLRGVVKAAVTCTRCHTSLAIDCRADVVERLGGGERAHGGGSDSLVRMAPRNGGTP